MTATEPTERVPVADDLFRWRGMLTGFALDGIAIGAPVALTTLALYIDEDGREVLTYAYAPDPTGAEVMGDEGTWG